MSKTIKFDLHSVADGHFIHIENVSDFTFAKKMLGYGYAVIPDNGIITSPTEGVVTSIFPTKHVIGIKNDPLELILHMGIDTVSLNGEPFNSATFKGQNVYPNTILSEVDLDRIKLAGLSDEMIVIFINKKKQIKTIDLIPEGKVKRGQKIGYIELYK